MNKRVLILACGNPQRGDDGVGWHVAKALMSGFCEANTKFYSHLQLLPEMAEAISDVELVIFLDASTQLTPGEVCSRPVEPCAASVESFTHSMKPAGLLALAKQLYGKAPEAAFLVTIGGESFGLSNRISKTVRQAIPEALDQVKAILSGVSLPQPIPRSQKTNS